MTDLNMPTSAPARKVVGASAGAGIGGVTAGLILWGLDDYVFEPHVANSVPAAVTAFVITVVPLALSFVGGYVTKRAPSEIPVVPSAPAPAPAPLVGHMVVPAPARKRAPAKKAPAKKAAKKVAPKPPQGLS